jgi:arylsulfatase A-like enzyme
MLPVAPNERGRRPRARLAALVLLGACGGRDERPGIAPRHLFLITVEGMRADHTSAHLYHDFTTWFEVGGAARELGRALSIDDLAADGVLFCNAFAPSGATAASLASLHTGRSPLEADVLAPDDALPEERTTLAESLAGVGFLCAGFVSREASPLDAGWDQGFERYVAADDDLGALAAAVAFTSDHDWGSQRPVFTWVHLASPSFPFTPGKMINQYDRVEVDYAARFTDAAYAGVADGSAAFRAAAPELTHADREHVTALYDGELAYTNYLIWYLLDLHRYFTATEDAWRETLCVLAGTNGLELFRLGHPWGDTGSLFDSTLHVPLLLRHPDSLTGRRILTEVVELRDVAPTLLEWFRVGAGAGTSGRSLLALTDSYVRRAFEPRPACAVLAQPRRYTARDGEWRLVADPAGLAGAGGALELFHSARDADELEDVAASHPDVVARLRDALRAWVDAGAAEE